MQILLGVLAVVLDAQLARDHVQVGEQLGLEFGYGHSLALWLVCMCSTPSAFTIIALHFLPAA